MATSYVYTNQQTGQKVENTEFHNVVLWRKLGEILGKRITPIMHTTGLKGVCRDEEEDGRYQTG